MSHKDDKLMLTNSLDFSGCMNDLWDNKKWIGLIVVLCLLGGTLLCLKQRPIYEANVLLQIEENQGHSRGLNPISQFLGDGKSSGAATQAALIKSRFILDPVIQTLGLDIIIKPKQSFVRRILFPAAVWPIEVKRFDVPFEKMQEPFRLRRMANDMLSLSYKKQVCLQGQLGSALKNATGSVQLEVASWKAPLGKDLLLVKRPIADIAKNLARRLKINDIGGKQSIGILDITFQDSNPVQVKRILNRIAKKVQEENIKKKSLEASTTLTFLYSQLPYAKKALEKAEAAYNHYRAQSGKIDSKAQSQQLLKQLEDLDKQIQLLQVNRVDLEQRYTNIHPTLVSLNEQIKNLRGKRIYVEAKLKNLPEYDQQAVNLLREIDVKSNLYTKLLNNIQELKVIRAGTVSDVRILSYARAPDAPMPSKRKLICATSVLLALIFSLVFIMAKRFLFPRVEDPNWLEHRFNIVNLAIIPYSKEQLLIKAVDSKSCPLLAHQNPQNLSIEALRSLRTSLQVQLSTAKNNIVSILGVNKGVGKTFVSSNLAYLLASASKRVLLIDADLRSGTMHRYFNVSPSPGFADVLQGLDPSKALIPSAHKQLMLLPRGSYPTNPSELLLSEHCKQLIKMFSEQFDIIIIDTPPVLLVSDAVSLSRLSAVNYLILGSKAHQPLDVEIVIKRLSGAKVNLHGSIFNFHNAEHRFQRYHINRYAYGDNEINP